MDNIANSFRHRHTKGKGIFVCDMSDLFGIGIPEEWTRRVMQTIRAFNDEFRFYLLTKQPQNLAKWSPFPENCYVGVTITNTLQAIDAVTPMAQIEAKVKFVSYEPLLEKVPCRHIMGIVNWAIIGQQTPIRPETMPKIEWIKNIVEAADEVKVPVFLKNNLRHIFVRTSEQASQETFQETFSWALDNSGMKLRQEMPE